MPRRRPGERMQDRHERDELIIRMINDHINDILEIAAQRIEQQLDPYDGYDRDTRDIAVNIVRDMKRHPE